MVLAKESSWPIEPIVNYSFELVAGFFVQELNETVPAALPDRFGLVDSSPQRWESFQDKVKALQHEEHAHDSKYKVFFVGRHGEGWHNVAEAKYGTALWDSYWSLLNTDGQIVWGPDPKLTPLGESQAKAVNTLWKSELLHSIPLPQSLYSSPLGRAMRTAEITFSDISYVEEPLIVEYVREVNGEHTCDKRSTRTQIHDTFPEFEIETGFTEQDELWTTVRETDAHVLERVRNVMDRVFSSDRSTYISITAHGGWITELLNLVGHRAYNIPTGGVIPLVIKATPKQ